MKEPNKTLIYDLKDLSYKQFKKICLELFKNRYELDEIDFFYSEKTHHETVLIYNDRLKWSLTLKLLCKPTANALELFITKPNEKSVNDFKTIAQCQIGIDTFNPQPHYNNENGSLYKIATERGWNAYIFDVVKRLDRGGKKDPLKQEIEKSIDVLKLWLIELQNK